jgi:predicted alpha/beta-hydrolase family hydrolase
MVNHYSSVNTSVRDLPVRGFLHLPAIPAADGLVLTHGAGSNCNAPLITALADAFCASSLAVLRCDLPFRQARPSGPPPRGSAERDQEGLRAAIAFMRDQVHGRLFLGGHSYGGRMASMLAAAQPGIADGLLLLSYPLHPPQRPQDLRTTHFPQLRTPSLFVHGARDGFATVDELQGAMQLIPGRTELLSIPGAGHELMTKGNRDKLPQQIVKAFLALAG